MSNQCSSIKFGAVLSGSYLYKIIQKEEQLSGAHNFHAMKILINVKLAH